MSWTVCLSSAAITRAGAYVNSDIQLSGTLLAQFSDDAEGEIEANTRDGFIADYSTLTVAQKQLASKVCAALIATDMITFDMGGYTSRQEATTMLNVLNEIIGKGMARLKKLL